MPKWNFAIVGAGVIAGFHAKAIKDIENANLSAVCDIDIERAKAFANEYGCEAYDSFEQMYDNAKIDIVTVATPSGLHLDATVAAAKKGLHTLVEKPLEVTVKRIDEIIKASESANVKTGCVFQTRYAASLDPLREAIKQGRFGTITYVGVFVPWWRSDEYYKDSWHGTWKFDGGGALMNQSIHMIDTLCELMPDIKAVQAFSNSIGHSDIEAEDTSVAVLKFSNGTLGTIHGSTASFPGQPKRLEIMGTKGTAVYLEDSYSVFDFKDKADEDEIVLQKYGQMNYKSGFSDPTAIQHTLHTACFADFIDAIENDREFKINGAEARKSVQLIQAIYESSRHGKLIKL